MMIAPPVPCVLEPKVLGAAPEPPESEGRAAMALRVRTVRSLPRVARQAGVAARVVLPAGATVVMVLRAGMLAPMVLAAKVATAVKAELRWAVPGGMVDAVAMVCLMRRCSVTWALAEWAETAALGVMALAGMGATVAQADCPWAKAEREAPKARPSEDARVCTATEGMESKVGRHAVP